MYTHRFTSILTVAMVVLVSVALVQAQTLSDETAVLSGLNENPPLVSLGSGQFKIHLEGEVAQYELVYNNLTAVTQAHIHLGNPGTNGSVIVFLCSNSPNAPTPTLCPENGTPVTGELTAAQVIAAMDGDRVLLAAGDFEGLKQAIVGGATYVNVHTEAHPGGELRGQINERTR